METFSVLLAFCAGNSPVPGKFPAQRPLTRSFDVLFDLRLNKRLSKQSWGCWFETLSCSLWRNFNGKTCIIHQLRVWISYKLVAISNLRYSYWYGSNNWQFIHKMITQHQYHMDWVAFVIIHTCEGNMIIVCMQQITLHANHVLLGSMLNGQLYHAIANISM